MTHSLLLRRILYAAAFAILLFCSGITAQAQSSPAGSLDGRWVGAFDIVHPDGSVDPDEVYLAIGQAGEAGQTGPAGQSGQASAAGAKPDHLSPASSVRRSGNSITLTVPGNGGTAVEFNLALEGGHLRGTVTGLPVATGSRMVVDVVRADSAWHPQVPVTHAPDTLAATIADLDRKLFDAYNTCDLATLGNLVSDDLEFYHDKTGLAVGRKPFITAIQNNICGKTRRELTPGSLEVHRLANYGALEIGTHRFTHPAHSEIPEGDAKFAMLWRYSPSGWQLTRVISYDHIAK